MFHRVSYTFGFTGPCVGSDTACSSSLVAAHFADSSVRNQQATAAIAAGVNAILSPLTSVAICQLQVEILKHTRMTLRCVQAGSSKIDFCALGAGLIGIRPL